MGLKSSALGDVHILFGDHRGVGAVVRALIPGVHSLAGIGGVIGEGDATEDAGAEEPPSEGLTGLMSGVNIGEIVHPSLLGDDGDATLVALSASAHPHGEGCGEEATNHSVSHESELELSLGLALVFPGPSLGAGH